VLAGDDGLVTDNARAEVIAAWRCSRCGPTPFPDRWNAAVIWTGREVLLFGGQSGHKLGRVHVDGAAYEPGSGRWRPMRPAPSQAGAQVAAVWTGNEAVFFGGYENTPPGVFKVTSAAVAYDPSGDSWRVLPPAPLAARAGAAAVWTGAEVVVTGGYPAVRTETVGPFSDTAACHPGTDTWRLLPAVPERDCPPGSELAYWPLELVWTGDRLMAWRPWEISTTTDHPRGRSVSGRYGIDRFEFTAGADTWVVAADDDPPRGVGGPLWTGSEVIVPPTAPFRSRSGPSPSRLWGARLDVAAHRWRPIATAPPGSAGASVWTGAALVSWGDTIAAWDPDADAWAVAAPFRTGRHDDSVAVWTGTEVLLVNARELYRLGG
jgi:hypothetical protein